MQVILLERIPKLGQMGDTVRVKNGFARNYLLPRGKALRANDANKVRFERDKAQLEARNLEARSEAEKVGEKLAGQSFVVIRSAGETGQLYGSVATRDVADILTEGGFTIQRSQVRLDRPVKTIGIMEILIALHPEVEVPITLNVARSEDEARRQTAGEDLTGRDRRAVDDEDDGEVEAEAAPEAEQIFEEGAGLLAEDDEASDDTDQDAEPHEDAETRRD